MTGPQFAPPAMHGPAAQAPGAGPQPPGAVPAAAPGAVPEPNTDAVTAAVASLDDLGELPVGEHVAYFDALHAALQDALASIDGV